MIRGLPAVVAGALVLRLPSLLTAPPLGDEYMQFYTALSRRSLGAFLASRGNPHHLLLDPLSTWLLARIGDSPALLRTPSLLWGLAAVWGLGVLGARAGRPRAGVWAALALAASCMHADWSIRCDFYAALSAAAVWSSVFLLDLERDRGRWPAYLACAAVFLHLHPYAALVAAIHGAHLSLRRNGEALRAWAACWGAAAVSFIPWFSWAARYAVRAHELDFWGRLGEGLPSFLLHLPLHLAAVSEAAPAAAGVRLFLLRGLAAACFLFWIASRVRARAEPPAPALALARLFLPLGLTAVVASDYAFHMYLAPRQLIFVLPFLLLEAAFEADDLALLRPRLVRSIGGALVGGCVLARAFEARDEAADGERLNKVFAAVSAACRPGDSFSFDDTLTPMVFLYHLDRPEFSRSSQFRGERRSLRLPCADPGRTRDPGPGMTWRIEGPPEDFTVLPPSGRFL